MRTARKPTRGQHETASRPAPELARAGVRPAKSRGQNFLTSSGVADRIVAVAEIGASDAVVEIGPGLGILTEKIVALPRRSLRLIELDARLASRLQERFASNASVEVLNADFLEIDPASIFDTPPVKVIGNLPFNVAAAILHRLSDNACRISRMVLMFQREVAARIRANPDDEAYGALSVFTALYWKIDLHFTVAAGSFHPRPKVDAEVLRFTPLTTSLFEDVAERDVLDTIRASFSAPRKTIRNSLAGSLKLDAARTSHVLERARIDPGTRAEKLVVSDFVRLANALRIDHAFAIVAHDA